MEKLQNEVQNAVETFEKYGIKATVNTNNEIIISHYCQPKDKTFKELGIDEDELIKNVIICQGKFETYKSTLTTFPLAISKELILDKETQIKELPNLKAVGILVCNQNVKKMPKLKMAGSISLENSKVKALPKLKEAGVLIAQNGDLEDLSNLETVSKLCVIDCKELNLKNLKSAQDVFICSSNEKEKIKFDVLNKLEEVENLFIANSTFKSMPKLKKAKKVAFYNCEIKSVKASLKAETEIKTQIKDEELSEKFDKFTDWYNSDILNESMELLGNIINEMKK